MTCDYAVIDQALPIFGRYVRYTRGHCPECGQHFLGWREGYPDEAMYVLCLGCGAQWITEVYFDYGPWPVDCTNGVLDQ